jgi:hypothetical protein
VTGTLSHVLGWANPQAAPQPVVGETTDPPDEDRNPGAAVREARIRNANYSARERGVEGSNEGKDGREKNWFNGNGLAQEAPPE